MRRTRGIPAQAEGAADQLSPREPGAWENAEALRGVARQWATRIGVKTPRIRVRQMRSRWASTSTGGSLTLNTALLTVPKPLGELVIVRELAHMLAPHHARIFKRVMREYMPDWQARERALKRYSAEHENRSRDHVTGKSHRPERNGGQAKLPASPRGEAIRAGTPSTRHATDYGIIDRSPRAAVASAPARTDTIVRPSPRTRTDERIEAPTVLVVDDDASIRWLLHEVLTLEGRTVQLAEHGGPALRWLRASARGMVVLFGLVMPYMDGEALLEAIAASPALASRHRYVVVTAAVSLATSGRVAELRKQLGIPLIPKPFTVEQLLDAVNTATRQLVGD